MALAVIDVPLPGRAHEIHVGPGLLAELGPRMRAAGCRGRAVLVADATVLGLWSQPALASLRGAGFDVLPASVAPGEASKTLAVAERLFGELVAAGIDRGDTVVALGGGVVGDLAGFVAATYHRGMPLVQVPTTLLAQVDSAIGGKVAVDHALAKNLIGAFHQPRLVLADTEVLGTLPRRERWNGMAEVVKAALIANLGLLASLELDLEALGEGTAPVDRIAAVVERCVRIKVSTVLDDERDEGRRLILNFGHTIGHALEALEGYRSLAHGEAVVLGMRGAVVVSERLGRLTRAEAARALSILARFPPPPPWERPAPAAVIAAMRRDKKTLSGMTRFVLLSGLGAATVARDVPEDLLAAGVAVALQAG